MTATVAAGSRLGVLLLNLGGPERLEDVKPFLYRLFSDPAILRIRSALLRRAAAWLIATARKRTSCGYYAKIGGGSPLRRITEEQAGRLSRWLATEGIHAPVYVGMSCWKPTIGEAVERIVADRVGRLILLPLFPQFSTATSGSALAAAEAALARFAPRAKIEVRVIRQWFDDPGYIAVLADTIRRELEGFSDPDPQSTHLLYSAHSIPRRYVDRGDPYLQQTEATVALVNRALGKASPWRLAFQSKVGPVEWLGPATPTVIAELGREGKRQVLVIPVSFVSDHIETLYEIDILYRDLAAAAGIAEFRRARAFNGDPKFISALGELVRREIGGWAANAERTSS